MYPISVYLNNLFSKEAKLISSDEMVTVDYFHLLFSWIGNCLQCPLARHKHFRYLLSWNANCLQCTLARYKHLVLLCACYNSEHTSAPLWSYVWSNSSIGTVGYRNDWKRVAEPLPSEDFDTWSHTQCTYISICRQCVPLSSQPCFHRAQAWIRKRRHFQSENRSGIKATEYKMLNSSV